MVPGPLKLPVNLRLYGAAGKLELRELRDAPPDFAAIALQIRGRPERGKFRVQTFRPPQIEGTHRLAAQCGCDLSGLRAEQLLLRQDLDFRLRLPVVRMLQPAGKPVVGSQPPRLAVAVSVVGLDHLELGALPQQ